MDLKSTFNFNTFYKLSDPLTPDAIRVSPETSIENKSSFKLESIFFGESDFSDRMSLKIDMGSKFFDVQWGTDNPLVLISNRIFELFVESQFSGWDVFPVNIVDKKGQEHNHFFGLTILGGHCDLDYSKSEVITRTYPEYNITEKFYKGIFFNSNQWDGSDFFRSNYRIFITKNVRDSLIQAKVSNVEIIPILELEISSFVVDFDGSNY